MPYRCHNAMKVSVGYAQQTEPSPMPFVVGPTGDDKVGSVVVKLG